MKAILNKIVFATALLFLATPGQTAETNSPYNELRALVSKIQGRIYEDKKTEEALAPELKEFDALFDKYKDQKTDEVAHILNMKALLYFQILDNRDKGLKILTQLKNDFPDTRYGKEAAEALVMKEQQEARRKIMDEMEKVQESLTVGKPFPPFKENDLQGKPLALENYKGKVVLVDFWATWCGPCVAEIPNVKAVYEKYHGKGLEVIGISRDEEKADLEAFITKHEIPWPQFFDGQRQEDSLARQYGVIGIPFTYLLDGAGKIIGKGLYGQALEEAVAKALKK